MKREPFNALAEVWPKCDHPMTPANTQSVGKTNNPQCRTCRREIAVRHLNKKLGTAFVARPVHA